MYKKIKIHDYAYQKRRNAFLRRHSPKYSFIIGGLIFQELAFNTFSIQQSVCVVGEKIVRKLMKECIEKRIVPLPRVGF